MDNPGGTFRASLPGAALGALGSAVHHEQTVGKTVLEPQQVFQNKKDKIICLFYIFKIVCRTIVSSFLVETIYLDNF